MAYHSFQWCGDGSGGAGHPHTKFQQICQKIKFSIAGSKILLYYNN